MLQNDDHTRAVPLLRDRGGVSAIVYVHSLSWHVDAGNAVTEDWRDAYYNHKLHGGDWIMADDGWVVRVNAVGYDPRNPYITTETCVWPLSLDLSRDGLYKTNIKAIPRRAVAKRPIAERADVNLAMHVVARALLAHNFNDAAARAITGAFYASAIKHPDFRKVLMTEALKWFNQAGISPADMLQLLYRRMQAPDVELPELTKAMRFYFALHPDFAYDESTINRRSTSRDAAAPVLPPYLGEPVREIVAYETTATAPAPKPQPQSQQEAPYDPADQSDE